jgi:hypothetical protein
MSELPQEELDRLVQQLKDEEVHAEDARLSSVESLKLWVQTHPALQQLGVIEAINQYGPAVLDLVRRLLGF